MESVNLNDSEQKHSKMLRIPSKIIAYIFALFILSTALQVCSPKATTDEMLNTSAKADISFLAGDDLKGRAFGTDEEMKAAGYIAERMKQLGLQPMGTDGYFQEFDVTPSHNPHEKAKVGDKSDSSMVGRNVIGYIDNGAEQTIIIGAHFDHLGMGGVSSLHRGEKEEVHNGADDNASGVSVILGLAEILSKKQLNNNVLVIAFTGEENGLWGSNYFTKNPTIDLEKSNYMLNFDMVGRLKEDKSLAINGTGTTPVWSAALDNVNTDSLKLIKKESGVGPSDHTSFYLNDIPVLHFFTGQHEDYHKPGDDVEKINFDGIVDIIRFSERLIVEVDDDGELEFTKTKDESENTPRFKVTLGVVPDYLFDGDGMRIDGVSEGKAAQAAGMEKGDIVIQLGDSTITDMMSYMRALSAFQKGDSTKVIFKRGDEEITQPVVF